MIENPYHTSVLLHECIDGLAIKPDGIYVDVTFGGGGHSRAILEKLGPNGRLFAFDQDPDAWRQAEKIDDDRLELITANFRHIQKYLRIHGIKEVDGIMADFGVSSFQLDAAERGFSTRFDGPLDMRMGPSASTDAAEVLNSYSAENLQKIFGMYGEIKNARTLAQAVVQARTQKGLKTTSEFKEILAKLAPRSREFKYFAQAFQAVRIEVNQELAVIEEFLEQAATLLSPGGRLVVLAFHSLEDRLVKNFIRTGDCHGKEDKDLFGVVHKPVESVIRKPITASEDELKRNPRSRSAKLRIAAKL
ncbi:16S rRNA (cytosine(1402)-N(4))-methyltransferase RsmH [Aquirufa ecclesiirivi]|uniref:Ribosomal RNA small subunit methyltransferase H n=1 Tax=Aquirufa ecclesiirivi TaxID=2715124 RepID=A0ABT4JIZ5_9BACT|nr:16S rRNA (cytosine(1402)-N(4))-methyltransferase RsmH [Aquirufa ecclesiirivi]MCZ2471729.1 16S rRNA (cytosine(1402)-N(4))-methyltransferase RsmH [Aquirufa ecclesiirivi]MCZ2476254.1 16S rRNA (cytosine(1402)-N(4))-methyltransferase RsmH [Aquirufa ecclesiirivi]MDF0693442.1 16S rRNA (cytosine(1402)-N(4))-methyltransferase RsmH [Aquirufa ecclesiirivi]NHC49348.1 16S rRNA (cytosine(1402)-N(4))-methyltransferase RsmH [Aquirufa ecclesiirivi]